MSSFGKQVNSTATREATSLGDTATVTPACFPAAAAAAELASYTTSGTPAFARFEAMGPPIVPSPMNPTLSAMTTSPHGMSGDGGRCLVTTGDGQGGARGRHHGEP